MVDIENAHIGPAAHPALLDNVGGGIKRPDEGHGTAGHPARGADPVSFRAQAGEGETGAAAALMDKRRILHRVKDGLHRVLNGQDKTGGQLSQLPARVHQRGGVGQELKAGHYAVELVLHRLEIGFGLIPAFRFGDGPGHSMEHLLRCFNDISLFVLFQVALLQDMKCVFG